MNIEKRIKTIIEDEDYAQIEKLVHIYWLVSGEEIIPLWDKEVAKRMGITYMTYRKYRDSLKAKIATCQKEQPEPVPPCVNEPDIFELAE
jgi:hypothetical protein